MPGTTDGVTKHGAVEDLPVETGVLPNELEQLRKMPRPTKRGEWGNLRMNLRKGFSLIELLVVIAVIAILAGIAFPVFARAKDSAFRSSDMSKLNELSTALHLYRNDQGAYPPALLGYATGYLADNVTPGSAEPTMANIVPADQVPSPLFPKRVPGLATFQPSYNRGTTSGFNREFAPAVWPTVSDAFYGGGAPGQKLQRYRSDSGASRCIDRNGDGGFSSADNPPIPRMFYKLSGFDAATVDNRVTARNELRYSLFFTGWSVAANPCETQANERGGSQDETRQVGYTDPPDTTVVTWDSFFREYDSLGKLPAGKREIVLFLGGSARPMDSRIVADQAWKVQP